MKNSTINDIFEHIKKQGNEHYKNNHFTESIEQYAKALGVLKFTASYANEELYTEEDEEYSRKKAILFTNLGLCYKAMEKYDEAFEFFGEA